MTREQALEIFSRGLEHFRHRKGYTMESIVLTYAEELKESVDLVSKSVEQKT